MIFSFLTLILSLVAVSPSIANHPCLKDGLRVERPQERQDRGPSIKLVGLGEADKRPEMAVYALDRSNKTIQVARVGPNGRFDLSEKSLSAVRSMSRSGW